LSGEPVSEIGRIKLAEANQKYDRQHQLQSLGYDVNTIVEKWASCTNWIRDIYYQKVVKSNGSRPGV
jgi:hypothetical protein